MASKRAEPSAVPTATRHAFRVQLFGDSQVLRSDTPVRLSPLQMALVAVVFGHGRDGLTRARVAGLLWGVEADSDARHRIRQLLVEIRLKVGVVLIESLADELRAAPDVECDLRLCESALERGDLQEAA